MKDWQHGYELDYLKSVESLYAAYNKFADSPFAEYKKNNIAEDLHKGHLHIHADGSYVQTKVSKSSPITMYQNITIGTKTPGDCVITKLRGTDDYIEDVCKQAEGNTWLYVWAEDKTTRMIAQNYFDYVGSKITTFGEIYGIYFKQGLIPTTFPFVDPVEKIAIKQLRVPVNSDIIEKIAAKLENLNIKFQNHYSNYNKKKSWSAISLRGYTPDIMRIAWAMRNYIVLDLCALLLAVVSLPAIQTKWIQILVLISIICLGCISLSELIQKLNSGSGNQQEIKKK